MKYETFEMTFPYLSVAALKNYGFLIACPSRSEYDEIIPLSTCLVIVFGIQCSIL